MRTFLLTLLSLFLTLPALADIRGYWDADKGVERGKECLVKGGITVHIAEDRINITSYMLVCSYGSVSKPQNDFLVQEGAILLNGEKVGQVSDEGFMVSYDVEELYIGKVRVTLNAYLQEDGTLLLNEVYTSSRGKIYDVNFMFNKSQL